MPVLCSMPKHVITFRTLEKILNPQAGSGRSNSVANPKEQYPTLSMPVSRAVQDLMAITRKVNKRAEEGDIIDKFAYLQLLNGCRVSQLLQVHCSRIRENGTFSIPAAKKGKQGIGHAGLLTAWLITRAGRPRLLFDSLNRKTVWYHFKKKGYQVTLPGQRKNLVTHAMRHAAATIAQKDNLTAEQIQDMLLHRSPRTQDHYKHI